MAAPLPAALVARNLAVAENSERLHDDPLKQFRSVASEKHSEQTEGFKTRREKTLRV
jgi:hypothetical protein